MAYGFYNLIDRLRRYYAFSRSEKSWLLISILVMGFIVGFDDGREVFELFPWLQNLLLGIVAVTIAVFVHESVHRIFGLEQGYRTEYKPFFYGLIAGLVLTFMSYGKLIFLAYSGVHLHIMEKARLGYFRYQLGYFQLGKISAMGPIANLLVAVLFKFLIFLPTALVDKIVFVNVLFAITNMLPIPPLDGVNVLYASRLVYFFMLGAVVALGLLLIYPWVNMTYALIIALGFGFLTVLFYFRRVEPKIGGSW